MSTKGVVRLLIALVGIVIVALQEKIILVTNGPHGAPDDAPKS